MVRILSEAKASAESVPVNVYILTQMMNFVQKLSQIFRYILASTFILSILMTASLKLPVMSWNFTRSLAEEVEDRGHSTGTQVAGGSGFIPPQLHPRGRPSGQQEPGGSRGDCPAVDLPLMALIPKPDEVWGLTTQEYPTYWVYIPYRNDQIHSIQFSLWKVGNNGDRQPIYRSNLKVNQIPGIVSFTPTESAAALAISDATNEQVYEWTVTVNCDDPQMPGGANKRRVEGSIARYVLPDSALPLPASESIEQAQIYAKNGFWYDTLTVLGNLHRQSDHEELKQLWTQLLSSEFVELESVTTQPLVD